MVWWFDLGVGVFDSEGRDEKEEQLSGKFGYQRHAAQQRSRLMKERFWIAVRHRNV